MEDAALWFSVLEFSFWSFFESSLSLLKIYWFWGFLFQCLNPLPTRAKYTQQPLTFLNDQSSIVQGNMNNQTFGDFICLMTYNNVLGCWVTSYRTYIYVLSRQGSNESHNNEQKMPSILTGIIIIHNNNTVNRWVLVERMFFSLHTMHFF